jgi:hypothetical protein
MHCGSAIGKIKKRGHNLSKHTVRIEVKKDRIGLLETIFNYKTPTVNLISAS